MTAMKNNSYFSNRTKTVLFLKSALDPLYDQLFQKERIYPLLLEDANRTRRNLNLAGALYQCAMTAIHYGQYRRASNYIAALKIFIDKNLPCSQ